MDAADGRLKHQKEPVAYLGGVAVFLPFITTLGLCYPFENLILWLLLGTTLLLFVGLIDDLKVLKPWQKFFGQFLAVLCFMKGEFSLKTPFFSSLANIFWSGFWMLSVINAFNLVDVMDGLCATLAITSASTFCLIAILTGKYSISVLLMAFIGSMLAFFMYNKPQAKIYLGDAGSLFIGGFLAAIPLLFSWDSNLFGWAAIHTQTPFFLKLIKQLCEVFFIPCLILGVPLLEVLSLFIIRSWLGIPFYNGSPHHFAIYLQRRGWSREKVLCFAAAASLLLSALVMLFLYRIITFSGLLGAVSILLLLWTYLIFYIKN